MILPSQEAARFYRIWWALLRYTNAQCRLIADPPAWPPAATLVASDADKLRQAVWADDSLREAFIAANPEALPAADLDVIASWQHRIAGKFFVLRHLKKYSVLLTERAPVRAYGVMGLFSSFEEVVGPHLPIAVRAVLLPFEGKIIYDGLLTAYNVTFGSGIRRSLGVASRNAQEREGIITSLLPATSPDEERSAIRSRNTKIIAAFRTALYKSGLSTKVVERHLSTIESFARGYLLNQEPPRGLLEMRSEDLEDYLAGAGSGATRGDTETQKAVVTGFKRFTRFLADSERIAWDTAADLHDLLAARR